MSDTTVEITLADDHYYINDLATPYATEDEAVEAAMEMPGIDFILGPAVETVIDGKPTHVRTCYELEWGEWEGFVSQVVLDA